MRFLALFMGMAFCVAASSAWTAGFQFRHHFSNRDLPGGSWAQTALVDVGKDNANEGRNHVDFLENLLITK